MKELAGIKRVLKEDTEAHQDAARKLAGIAKQKDPMGDSEDISYRLAMKYLNDIGQPDEDLAWDLASDIDYYREQ